MKVRAYFSNSDQPLLVEDQTGGDFDDLVRKTFGRGYLLDSSKAIAYNARFIDVIELVR